MCASEMMLLTRLAILMFLEMLIFCAILKKELHVVENHAATPNWLVDDSFVRNVVQQEMSKRNGQFTNFSYSWLLATPQFAGAGINGLKTSSTYAAGNPHVSIASLMPTFMRPMYSCLGTERETCFKST